ncbi:MAG TPA: class I SAM-dependent methyltransferase, partial [Vicinamibacterales bacterium]|nr:class I SAM-dependent methyltransferase [Vicinamibacterales bacterium]
MLGTAPALFDGPLNASSLPLIHALRDVLATHGFTGSAATDAIGPPLPPGKAHLRDDLPLYLHRLAAPTPINTLVKLFMLDRTVDEQLARQAFAPLELDDVRGLGLIEYGPRGVRACLRLSMHDGLLLAHDAYDEETRTLRADHVLDVNPTTIALSNLTVRRHAGRALEIGTGCGALALRAARHADHVVGTDTNPRALNVAVFNAAINGISNVEFRLGSLYDAVDGETFDLIFCNPPYVISPDSQFIFRDGGRRGDALCEEIVRRTPAYLNDGGFATFLVNWVVRAEEEWSAPLRRWVDNNNCDSWLMMSAAQDPVTYAGIWTRSRDRDGYAAALDRWIRYFNELEAAVIGLGAVVLRKRGTAAGWVRADRMLDNVTAPAGAHIERLFAAEDRLSSLSGDAALLDSVFVAATDHQLQQRLKLTGGRYVIDSAQVALDPGLPFYGSVDAYATQLLARCTGERTLRAIAEEIAVEGGVSVP